MPTLAAAESALLLSVYKPLVMLVVFALWAWAASKIDKDIEANFLNRPMWNGVQMGAGFLGFLLWLLLPWFWVGIWLALMAMAGGMLGYAVHRNSKVDPDKRWRLSLDSFRAEQEAAAYAKAQAAATVRLQKKDGSPIELPGLKDPAAAAHAVLAQALDFALPRKAERMDLAVGAQQTALVVTIDGVKYPQPAPDAKTAVVLIDYLKGHAGMDTADRRKKQTGELRVDGGLAGKHVLGLVTAGSTRELLMQVHFDPGKRMSLPLDQMGLLETQRQQLAPVFAAPKGVVLVAAPPHQGLTTSLYSFLHQHDPYTLSIMTLEEEVAFQIEGVTHNTIDPGSSDANIAQKLATLLRSDPQVMMVSKVSDAASAKLIAKSGGAECRVYAGLRQEDTFVALKAWVKAIGAPALAAGSLRAIVAQRLVRRLCMTCRVAFTPDPAALKRLNLPADKVNTLYKHSGKVTVKKEEQTCPTCMGIGYQGRMGVFEVMVLDAAARQLIAQGQFDPLRIHLRKQKMLWLQEAALAKVVEGATSISEITRALAKAE